MVSISSSLLQDISVMFLPVFFMTFVSVLIIELILPKSTPARLIGRDPVVGVVVAAGVVVSFSGAA